MNVHEKIAAWALSGTTGASATSIAAHLSGIGRQEGNYPHDASDFGRCERLLDMVPELRADFARMAEVNRYWAALVPMWDEIKAAPDRTKMIREIIRPIEAKDNGVIRLGEGVSMRFGGIK
jgi:hypothetical protein